MSSQEDLDDVVVEAIRKKDAEVMEFVKGLPEDWRVYAAEGLIQSALNWSASSLYEALGILEEAKSTFRKLWEEAEKEEEEKEKSHLPL
jgi:hypothetical protein